MIEEKQAKDAMGRDRMYFRVVLELVNDTKVPIRQPFDPDMASKQKIQRAIEQFLLQKV